MTLTVQQYDGMIDNANAYGSVAGMQAYCLTRGLSLGAASDERLSQGLVDATDFLDSCYSFIGDQLRGTQGTACPRYLPSGSRSHTLRDVNLLAPAYLLTPRQWDVLVAACYQLAQRSLTSPLMPDPTRDASGLTVVEKTVKAGPIETTKKFADRGSSSAKLVPSYPLVDLALRNAGLIASSIGGTISRA